MKEYWDDQIMKEYDQMKEYLDDQTKDYLIVCRAFASRRVQALVLDAVPLRTLGELF